MYELANNLRTIKLSKDVLDSFEVNNVEKLNEGINYFLSVKRRNIDAKTDKVVPSSELMFIEVKSKSIIDYNNKEYIKVFTKYLKKYL